MRSRDPDTVPVSAPAAAASDSIADWFAREILAHEAALTRYLHRIGAAGGEALDNRQEIYIRVLESAERQRPAQPKAFLFATARNLIVDRARRRRIVPIEALQDVDTLNVLIEEQTPERATIGLQDLLHLKQALDRRGAGDPGTSPPGADAYRDGSDRNRLTFRAPAAGRRYAQYDFVLLLGGAVRDRIQYFGFPQGNTAQELARDASLWTQRGCKVIYVKIGRGEELDLAIAREVRAAIGQARLRLDANEAWDVLTAHRMIKALANFDVEFIEQPTNSDSLSALAHVRENSTIAIAADQLAFTPEDVYAICSRQAADLIVLGLHETGGIDRFRKAASIAEAAGLNVCLHGLYETGITTCASNQIGATLANLDDGNQYMNHLLIEDIVARPNLALQNGQLPVLSGPGFGFELDWDAVGRAEEAYLVSLRP